ncbi:asparaginase [Paenibacillus sp. YYML68]|uniref:asparaginase n=1 Tax=Paenibacillus sp. YYML68 TaxID=2909250 RepID=UPI00248F9CDA|nr:asparaginase [Paenibacillus sp. YYML68]
MSFPDSDSAIIAVVRRGELVESLHRGHIVAVHASGQLAAWAGDPRYYTYARSTAKLLQALPLLEEGGVRRLGLTDAEIALVASSHNGEPAHTAAVASILHKAGLDVSALDCGAQEPLHKREADRLKHEHLACGDIHNTCSGKHAGMLALAVLMNESIYKYTSPNHPVQQKMLRIVSEMSGCPPQHITIGIDGCGVPVFGLPLAALAAAYAKLGKPDDLSPVRQEACRTLLEAIARAPYYIAGTGRFDTRLSEVTDGRVIGKMGAEGVYAATAPAAGLGLALKLEDGAERALYAAATEALLQLGLLTAAEAGALASFHRTDVVNRRGEVVGTIKPGFTLNIPSTEE